MQSYKRIIVVGSSNTDMVIKTGAFPQPGETLLGGEFFMFPGGKGANQAVAAARLGGDVVFIAKVGNDVFGERARQQFSEEGIAVDHLLTDPDRPSGVALITVDAKGENTIVVAQGSNATLSPEDLARAQHDFRDPAVVLMQLEIPLPTVLHAAQIARSNQGFVILNPAPAQPLPPELLKLVNLITPNRTEAETLTGIPVNDVSSATQAAHKFRGMGIAAVVITLGREGAFVFDGNEARLVPTPSVTAIDSTAAGDVFNGALAVALAEGKTLFDAADYANRAAAISVTRMGAQSSAPYKKELT